MDELEQQLWTRYVAIAPDAPRVHALLSARGEEIVNDHIAFRTLAPLISLEDIAAPFVARGYEETGRYRFEKKQLDAVSYSKAGAPRVFISAFDLGVLDDDVRAGVEAAMADRDVLEGEALLLSGRSWSAPRVAVLEELEALSEYVAWVVAHGICANHFTVSFNALSSFDEVAALNDFLRAEGLALNGAPDNEIQGGPRERLEQSSTKAPLVEVEVEGGTHRVPGAYYEFARRYEGFDGFVTVSADKIFESTNREPLKT